MAQKENCFFLATPLYSFRDDKLVWNQNLQEKWKAVIQALEKENIKVVVAFRDLDQNKSGEWLRKKEFKLIKNSLGVIVILGNTPGIYAETGFAKGVGKKLYGIRTDKLEKMGPKVQNWIESMFDAVFDSPQELAKYLSDHIKG